MLLKHGWEWGDVRFGRAFGELHFSSAQSPQHAQIWWPRLLPATSCAVVLEPWTPLNSLRAATKEPTREITSAPWLRAKNNALMANAVLQQWGDHRGWAQLPRSSRARQRARLRAPGSQKLRASPREQTRRCCHLACGVSPAFAPPVLLLPLLLLLLLPELPKLPELQQLRLNPMLLLPLQLLVQAEASLPTKLPKRRRKRA